VIATGEVTTLAGSAGSSGSADGTGAAAKFNNPSGITTDGSTLYVADTWNHTIRKIVISTGEVTTLAGSAGLEGSLDGTGAAVKFNNPYGITTYGTNLYVADTNNNTIRKIVIATGAVTTLAGSAEPAGSADGTGTAARFKNPYGITTDGNNLYVADTYNNTIRKIVIAAGEVTTLAGSAGSSGSANGTGAAARFNYPQGITTDGTNLYVTDGNSTIRKIVIATGEVTTLAGSGLAGFTDGTGAAARFKYPCGITTEGTNLYVADTGNNTIRKIVIATGEVTTLAGSGLAGSANGTGAAAKFNNPSGITTDGSNLYVADTYDNTIRKIVIATGEVTTLAGSGLAGSTDGTGTAAKFNNPSGITTDGTNLYVADTNNNTIRKIVIATGAVTTLAGSAGLEGSADGIGAAATFNNPGGVTTDGISLYVTDSNNELIRKIQ
jgi:sugar lactone lactonase YvrE